MPSLLTKIYRNPNPPIPLALGTYLFVPGPKWCFSDTAGLVRCKNGDKVAVWKNWTGSGVTMTQATSGNRPTLQWVNNRWAIRFDGSSSFLTADSSLIIALNSPAGLSWGLAAQMTSLTNVTGTRVFLRANQAGGTNAALWGCYYQGSAGLINHARQTGGTFVGHEIGRGCGTFYATAAWDLTADTILSNLSDQIATMSGVTATPGIMTGFDLGRDNVTATNYSAMDCFGLVLANTTWPVTTQNAVSAYLRQASPTPQFQATLMPAGTVVFPTGPSATGCRIPAICNYSGTLIAAGEYRSPNLSDSNDADIVIYRSTDGGLTWGAQILVIDGAGNCARNSVLIADPTRGKVHLIYCHQPFGDANGHGATSCTCLYTSSSDAGLTWAAPTDITSQVMDTANWSWLASGPGQGICLSSGANSGRLIVPFDHSAVSYGSPFYKAHVCYSDDGGTTWTRGSAIGPVGANEAAITVLGNGTTLLLSTRVNNGTTGRYISTSTDQGTTWPANGTSDQRMTGSPTEGAVLYANGLLIHSWITDTVSRTGLALISSNDSGTTWNKQTWLDSSAGVGYSSMCDLGNGTIGILYEAGAAVGNIKFAILPIL